MVLSSLTVINLTSRTILTCLDAEFSEYDPIGVELLLERKINASFWSSARKLYPDTTSNKYVWMTNVFKGRYLWIQDWQKGDATDREHNCAVVVTGDENVHNIVMRTANCEDKKPFVCVLRMNHKIFVDVSGGCRLH